MASSESWGPFRRAAIQLQFDRNKSTMASFADRIKAKAAAARTAEVIPAATLEEGIEPTVTAAEKSNTYARMTRKQPTELPSTTSEIPADENIGVVVPVIVTTTTTPEPAPEPTPEPAPEPTPEPAAAPQTVALPGGGTGIVLSSLARRGSLAVTEELLEQPAVSTRPIRSYKIPMGPYTANEPINWLVQRGPQGAREPLARTSNGGIRPVGGGLLDFHLTISKSDDRDRSHDWRLAVVFIEPDGSIAEINLNAVNHSRDDGELYVTSTARSMLASLMAAAHSADDMEALTTGCRFTAIAGKRAAFINLEAYARFDGTERGEWLQLRGTLSDAPSDPLAFADQLTTVKLMFRADGLLQATPAVQGDLPGRQVLEAHAEVVD